MSLGWTIGDIYSALQLTNHIVAYVRNTRGPKEHFQKLVSELNGLELALCEITELTASPDQTPDIEALKFTSCHSEESLSRFLKKERYSTLKT